MQQQAFASKMKLLVVLVALTALEGHLLRHKLKQPDATDKQLKDAHQRTLAAERKLQSNIWEAQHLTRKLVEQEDKSAQEQEIKKHEKIVANETESKALATFLGSMWREMHQFAGPFYVEHVEEELKSLEVDRGQLEADLRAAKDDEYQLNHLQQSISKAGVDSDSEEEEEYEEASSDKESEAGSHEKEMEADSKTALGSAESLGAGMDETAKQLGHLANHGLSAGAYRPGLYPVDLSGGTPLGHVAAHAAKSVADAEAAEQVTGKIQLQGDASDEESAATRAAGGVKHMSHAALDAGLESTVDQFEHFRTHGIGAGAAPREGLYPVNLGVEKQPTGSAVSVAAQKSKDASTVDNDSGVGRMSHTAIAAGLDATLKQVRHFGKAGLATGDKRDGFYPVDLSAHRDVDSVSGADLHVQAAKDDDDDDDDDDNDDQEDEDDSLKEAAAGIGSRLHESTAQGITKGLGKTLQQFRNLQDGSTGLPVRTGVYPVQLAMNQA